MIYYAHSKRIYGTKREAQELEWLRVNIGEVLCPHNDLGELGSIEPYLKKLTECKETIVSEYAQHIGKGTFQEIVTALHEGQLVRVLRKVYGKYQLFKVCKVVEVDAFDWKIRYGKVILEEV